MNDCIEWNKSKDRNGYGHRSFRGKNMLAHRVSWILAYGEIPNGLNVLHRCDNPSCVNPSHLFLGTQKDNIKDCQQKGRISRESRNVGRTHGMSKLSEQTVIRIKMLHGIIPARKVGEWIGMSGPWIGGIMRGDVWRHVNAGTRYNF